MLEPIPPTKIEQIARNFKAITVQDSDLLWYESGEFRMSVDSPGDHTLKAVWRLYRDGEEVGQRTVDGMTPVLKTIREMVTDVLSSPV